MLDDEIPLEDAYRCLASSYLKAGLREDAADVAVRLKAKRPQEDDIPKVIPWNAHR
jgi:hypothetical protein